MKILYSKKSLKFLSGQNKTTVFRIRNAIERLTYSPPEGDIKPLQGSTGNKMRLRVGTFRVIYWYSENLELTVLYIDDIGNRGDIYK